MLVALFTILFLAGGGGGGLEAFTKESQKIVKEHVADRAAADAIVTEMKSASKSLNKVAKDGRKRFKEWSKTDSDHSTGAAELQPLVDGANEYRAQAGKIFIDGIFEMREHMTAEEWDSAIKARLDGAPD